MREEVACVEASFRSAAPAEYVPEPIHYTGTSLVEAFGETRTVEGWARHLGDGVESLRRRLNAFAMLPPELALSLPKGIRIRDVPLGAPKSWTWDVLPWESDRWAQRWVAAHPGGATLAEVGEAIGVTRERVRQLEENGLRKFERAARKQGLSVQAMFEALRELRDQRVQVLP